MSTDDKGQNSKPIADRKPVTIDHIRGGYSRPPVEQLKRPPAPPAPPEKK